MISKESMEALNEHISALITILWTFNSLSLPFLAEINSTEDPELRQMYNKLMENYGAAYFSLREIKKYLDDQKAIQFKTKLLAKLGGADEV